MDCGNNDPTGYEDIGDHAPAGWTPKLTMAATVKLILKDGRPEFILSGDVPFGPATILKTDQTELTQVVAWSGVKGALDLSVITDCRFVIYLDNRAFQGWLVNQAAAIKTEKDHKDKYFELQYYDSSTGTWIDRAKAIADGLKECYAIRFGAMWIGPAPLEKHKVSFNFLFSGSPNYHDPDIRNPVDP